jgi:hypothetical protein
VGLAAGERFGRPPDRALRYKVVYSLAREAVNEVRQTFKAKIKRQKTEVKMDESVAFVHIR